MQTTQQKLKAALEQAGLPYKQIECYGSQIVITAHSQDSAIKWGLLLARFAKVRRAGLEALDEAVEQRERASIVPTSRCGGHSRPSKQESESHE